MRVETKPQDPLNKNQTFRCGTRMKAEVAKKAAELNLTVGEFIRAAIAAQLSNHRFEV